MGTPHDSESVHSYGKGIRDVDFEFPTNGSSDPASFKGAHIESVEHTATGVWTLTFESGFQPTAWLNGHVHVRDDANARARIALIDQVAKGASVWTATIVVTDLATPSLADVAADADSIIKGSLRFKMSPVKDSTGHGGL